MINFVFLASYFKLKYIEFVEFLCRIATLAELKVVWAKGDIQVPNPNEPKPIVPTVEEATEQLDKAKEIKVIPKVSLAER